LLRRHSQEEEEEEINTISQQKYQNTKKGNLPPHRHLLVVNLILFYRFDVIIFNFPPFFILFYFLYFYFLLSGPGSLLIPLVPIRRRFRPNRLQSSIQLLARLLPSAISIVIFFLPPPNSVHAHIPTLSRVYTKRPSDDDRYIASPLEANRPGL
jgi:hypothetical protein